jgi:hypothetical protein
VTCLGRVSLDLSSISSFCILIRLEKTTQGNTSEDKEVFAIFEQLSTIFINLCPFFLNFLCPPLFQMSGPTSFDLQAEVDLSLINSEWVVYKNLGTQGSIL